jgi:ubiquinone biosynthesis UbiH/UbiF/VisC/COQ6 family hydroxylase
MLGIAGRSRLDLRQHRGPPPAFAHRIDEVLTWVKRARPDAPHHAPMTMNQDSSRGSSDVVIVGAGPAGLALASALADAGMRVRVLEAQPLAALEAPADDGREIALSHRSRRLMENLGLWQALPAHAVAPLREARVLDGANPRALRFTVPADPGAPLGWLVSNHLIRAAALAAARQRAGVSLECEARVVALDLGPERARVTLADGQVHDAALVVAADSRFSQTRRLAGIGAAMRDFGHSVVLACMAHAAPNDGIAWERFRYGNTLALLPMNGHRSSAVVTVPANALPEWLALPPAEFAARIEAQSEGRLGAMRLVGERRHFPLVGVYARRFVAQRFALVGDAAVGMHPVTAHGWNFGLYGVEVLARELHAARLVGADIGAPGPLEAFERTHRRATWPIYAGTNALVSLFTDERAPARLLRRAVLDTATRLPLVGSLVNTLVTRQLTGDGQRAVAPPPRLRALPPSEGNLR